MQYTIGRTTRSRYNRSAGNHRKQRVLVSRILEFIYANLGRYLYIVGASIEREEKHLWRAFRHAFAAVGGHVWSWVTRLWAIVASAVWTVLGDLFNPFIKTVKGVFSFFRLQKELRGRPRRFRAARNKAFFHYGWAWNKHLVGRFLSYVLPVACGAVCFFTLRSMLAMNYAIGVTYNGQQIGYVTDESVYDSAVSIIDDRMIDVGESGWNPVATLTIEAVSPSEISTQESLANRLLAASGTEIMEATGLYVGGQFYGATTAGDLLQIKLDEVIEPYVEFAETLGDDVSVKYAREVELISGIYPASAVVSYDDISNLVTSEEKQDLYYSAKRGESTEAIAAANGITAEKLIELNPKALIGDTIEDDAELLVAEDQAVITVRTTRVERKTERIGFQTVVTRDSRFPNSYFWIVSGGEEGEKTITTEIVYENGEEVSREVVSEEISKQPVAKEIVIGTSGAGSGPSVGTGYLTWPTGPGGGISRGFSSTHGGMDIWNVANTPIYAADSGVVIVSQDTTVGYGRYIIIDHQNGMQTLYGHMNTRLAEVGEVVAKGQLIGLMGSTGQSTGNHLHFEVRLGGGYNSRVDPAPFLYGN